MQEARPRGAGRRDRRHGDDDRLPEHASTRRAASRWSAHDMTRKAAEKVYEQSGLGPENVARRSSCTTASRRNELITYEGARPLRGGQGRRAHRRRRQHLRRQVGREPVGRPDLQGPPARRHGPRAVRRAHLAAARPGREAPGRRAPRSRCSTTSASAARPSSRCTASPSARERTLVEEAAARALVRAAA